MAKTENSEKNKLKMNDFYRAKHRGARGIAKASCPSVRLSITLRYRGQVGILGK